MATKSDVSMSTCIDSYGSAIGMPQLCTDWASNQIFWLVVTLVAIFFVLSRLALPRISAVLSERQGTITNDLAAAENLKSEAEQAEEAYKKALEDARLEASKIIESAKAEIKQELDVAIEKADADISVKASASEEAIAEIRKDAVVFASPERADVVNVSNSETQKDNVIDFFNSRSSSSYCVFDSGYKYMYDKYSDVYRFVPLNGDIAGLAARTDLVADSWFSPAGFNRGNVRGAVKLAFNPSKSQRDELYMKRINPVCTFPGQGTVLFGDKTALSSPSAFDRINVRRLFITLEKAISTASKFQLFEFNDEFTRANFRAIVEPFLREVQGRRGITDFLVVCDNTNNTGDVIDRNEFVAEIFVKPNRSINFIKLQFVATRTGVSFEEVIGNV